MEAVESWVTSGDRVALATVVDTKKSAPQPSGTKMAVNDGGKMIGAVSGGCVEGQVVQVAEGILAGDDPQLLHYGIADEDAWDVGLPCGGEISIWVETYEGTGLQGRFAELARRGGRGALVTVLEGPKDVGAKLLVTEGEAAGRDPGQPGAGCRRDGAGGRGDVVRAQRAARARRQDPVRRRGGPAASPDHLRRGRFRRSARRRGHAWRVGARSSSTLASDSPPPTAFPRPSW